MALVNGGGYAEYVVADGRHLLPVPPGLSLTEAAGLPETVLTVWYNTVMRGGLKAGDDLLVHGGASGIGTTAIQIARALGVRTFVTAGSAARCRACTALGATRAINYTAEDFVAVITEATSGRGVDMILDMVGGDYVQRNLDCLADLGRLVQIAFLRGMKAEIDLMTVMRKRITLTGSLLRPRSGDEKAAITAEVRDTVLPWIASGLVRPVLHGTFPLADAAEAHRAIDDDHVGKIVLLVDPSSAVT